MMLFGWIIIGQFLVVIGAVIFLVALTGWIREARAEFSSLRIRPAGRALAASAWR